jgi:hypothetical protein
VVTGPLRLLSSPAGVAVWEGSLRGMVWLVLGGALAKFGDTPCVLPLLSGGLRLPGCPRGGSKWQCNQPAKAKLQAGGADDDNIHERYYLA